MLLMWISLLGARPSRGVALGLGAAAIMAVMVLQFRRRLPRPQLPRLSEFASPHPAINLLLAPPMLMLLAAGAFVLIVATGMPVVNWDAFNIWAAKAKILANAPLTPRPAYLTDVTRSFSHLDYPLLLPMLLAGAYGTMGQMNEQLGKLVLPVLLVAQALLTYAGARLWLGRLPALLVAVLAICPRIVVEFAIDYTAEMPLATFMLGSYVYLARWIMLHRRADAALCALFTVFAANTKNEGIAVAGIIAMLLVIFAILARRDMRISAWLDVGTSFAILSIGIGIWLLWRRGLPHSDENYPGRLSIQLIWANLGRLGLIFRMFRYSMTSPVGIQLWGYLWKLIPLVAILGWGGFSKPATLALWALFLVHLGVYAFIYVITSWDVQTLIRDSMHRLLMHVAPNAALLIAAHWGAAMQRSAITPILPVESDADVAQGHPAAPA
jgi:hypothetical protein